MRPPSPLLLSIAVGLMAWAIVLSMRLNPISDLSRLKTPSTAVVRAVPAVRSGAELYASACASCHQNRGEGRFPVFPPLAGSPWANGDPKRLAALTLHGVSGPLEVNGIEYSGLMPGFSHLTDRELARLLRHVRTSWGNESGPLTAADVAAVRLSTRGRRTPWSAQDLEAPRSTPGTQR